MQQPLVSIGVPTYNRPCTLERTLQCLALQTYRNLEVIVSDNCSTNPDVAAVLARYSPDKRFRIFVQPENKGPIFNFNVLLSAATGAYFMRLADDDWIDPDYIQSCVEFLEANPDYVGVYGQTRLYKENDEFLKYDPALSLDQDTYFERLTHYYELVVQNGAYYSLIRSEHSHTIGVQKQLGDDWIAIARLAFLGKLKMLDSTNLNLSLGGTGGSIEAIVRVAKLSKFNSYFPYFSIGINALRDILYRCKVYKQLSFARRLALGRACFGVIYNRFNVRKELKGRYKVYIKAYFTGDR